jgi:signal transduction histidine kinase
MPEVALSDRFTADKDARTGNSGKMGLGLAISKALVMAQGGDFRRVAGKDQGTP